MTNHFDARKDHASDNLILAALRANSHRPAGLPLDTEEALDAYVMGVEQAARMLGSYLGCPQRAEYWLSGKGQGQ